MPAASGAAAEDEEVGLDLTQHGESMEDLETALLAASLAAGIGGEGKVADGGAESPRMAYARRRLSDFRTAPSYRRALSGAVAPDDSQHAAWRAPTEPCVGWRSLSPLESVTKSPDDSARPGGPLSEPPDLVGPAETPLDRPGRGVGDTPAGDLRLEEFVHHE